MMLLQPTLDSTTTFLVVANALLFVTCFYSCY